METGRETENGWKGIKMLEGEHEESCVILGLAKCVLFIHVLSGLFFPWQLLRVQLLCTPLPPWRAAKHFSLRMMNAQSSLELQL